MDDIRKQLVPGARVRVIQQIPHRDRVWTTEVSGTIVAYEQKPTGSWFAHSAGDKLWLDRLLIRKDDGEMTMLNLDEYTAINIEAPPSANATAPAAAPPIKGPAT